MHIYLEKSSLFSIFLLEKTIDVIYILYFEEARDCPWFLGVLILQPFSLQKSYSFSHQLAKVTKAP